METSALQLMNHLSFLFHDTGKRQGQPVLSPQGFQGADQARHHQIPDLLREILADEQVCSIPVKGSANKRRHQGKAQDSGQGLEPSKYDMVKIPEKWIGLHVVTYRSAHDSVRRICCKIIGGNGHNQGFLDESQPAMGGENIFPGKGIPGFDIDLCDGAATSNLERFTDRTEL
jgi:hypothetical protein